MNDAPKVPPPTLSIDTLKSVSYDPSTGALQLVFPQAMSAEVAMTMDISIHLEAKATETLLSAIRHIEKELGGPIEVPKIKRSVQ